MSSIIIPNIIIPSLSTPIPVIDRTEFKDGRIVIWLWLEKMPLWVSGIIPAILFDQANGWITYSRPPLPSLSKRYKGTFFPLRRDAIGCAEEAINVLVKQLFPQQQAQ